MADIATFADLPRNAFVIGKDEQAFGPSLRRAGGVFPCGSPSSSWPAVEGAAWQRGQVHD